MKINVLKTAKAINKQNSGHISVSLRDHNAPVYYQHESHTISYKANEIKSLLRQAEETGNWHKAAICYAYRAKHEDELGRRRGAAAAAARELNTHGFGPSTIEKWANIWEEDGLPDIRPGDEVEIPDAPWTPLAQR